MPVHFLHRLTHRALALLLLLAGAGPLLPVQAQPLRTGGQHPEEVALAMAAMDRQEWDEAVRVLTTVLRQNPDDLQARYLRGIAYREENKTNTLFVDALRDFRYVVQRDSLVEDVLYQMGLTLTYRQQYPRDLTDAVHLAERQLALKPDLLEANAGIFRIYREFLRAWNRGNARDWMEEHGSPYARYFTGEMLRDDMDYYRADSTFAALLQPHTQGEAMGLPLQPVLLARARVLYAMGEDAQAQPFVTQAIRSIDGEKAALFLYHDYKYVFNLEEMAEYRRLRTPEEYQAFFTNLWEKRDPMPATPVNARLAGHYRRMMHAERYYAYTGFRAGYNAPIDPASNSIGFVDADFPPTHELATEFDDRGIVYIRHGEPEDNARMDGGESWRYVNPPMEFHFMTAGGGQGVGNYRLRPSPHTALVGHCDPRTNTPVYDGPVADWDNNYRQLLPCSMAGSDRVEDLIVREAEAYLEQGLTTDRHTWTDNVLPVDLPFVMAAFRGPQGRTMLDVYYAVPLGILSRRAGDADTVSVELGITLHDYDWNRVGTYTETKFLRPEREDRDAAAIDFFGVAVPPDSYHVALHLRSLTTNHLGGYRFDDDVPDLSSTNLAMSDLLPAYRIEPARPGSRYNRGDLYVEVNPFRTFPAAQPVNVYFEVYNLTYGADDLTRYSVEYTLRSVPEDGGILVLFRGDEEGVALSFKTEGSGSTIHPVEYTEIDVSRVPPGEYVLQVTVMDEHTGSGASRALPILLQSAP